MYWYNDWLLLTDVQAITSDNFKHLNRVHVLLVPSMCETRKLSCAPSTPLEAGERFVAVKWGLISVVGVYAPPRWDLVRYKQMLYELEVCVRKRLPGRVMVAEAFNAKSTLWGFPRTDGRGKALVRWAAGLGLMLLNTGRESTFVSRRETSIIDLTWANPPPGREVSDWRAVTDQETMSDHLYIEMTVRATPPELLTCRRKLEKGKRRWALKKVDRDLFEAAILGLSWRDDGSEEMGDVDEAAKGLIRVMTRACDVAMPRLRRRWQKVRAGRRDALEEEEAGEAWRAARQNLSRAIFAAKERAWKELLASVDEDPWGRPYKLVQNKLRPWAPPLTKTLDPHFVETIVGTLFPIGDGGQVLFPGLPPWEWDEEMGVSEEELARALRRVRRGKVLGPNGIPERA
ncbi:uncharacterized protein [Temnothorax longispinosus]|uniref:uncharacterized protein n=1 Tax=Temnothorax longispinosus TaxID=300112 RepID=UPI003A9948CA